MRTFSWLLSLMLAGSGAMMVTFDSTASGEMPPGWSAALTDSGPPAHWEVVRDSTAPSPPKVLAQISTGPKPERFPLAILNQANFKDGEVSVRFKAVSGKVDRAAGLVVRYWDPNNYYFVRVDALSNQLGMFKVQRGRLTPLKGRSPRVFTVAHNIPSNQWGTLKVAYRGPVFNIYLNHRRLLQVQDSSYLGPGKVGLWTQADSVTYFDNFEVKPRS